MTYTRLASNEAEIVKATAKTPDEVVETVRDKLDNFIAWTFGRGEKTTDTKPQTLIVKRSIERNGKQLNALVLKVGIGRQTAGFVPLPKSRKAQIESIMAVRDDLGSWREDLYACYQTVCKNLPTNKKVVH